MGVLYKCAKRLFAVCFKLDEKKLDCIIQKIKQNNTTLDQRGHHNNRPHKILDDVKQYVRENTESFLAESLHYSRHHEKYLSVLLNLSKMHSLYVEKCVSEKKSERFRVKKCSYVRIFETCYNLSFSGPRSETCSTCDLK